VYVALSPGGAPKIPNSNPISPTHTRPPTPAASPPHPAAGRGENTKKSTIFFWFYLVEMKTEVAAEAAVPFWFLSPQFETKGNQGSTLRKVIILSQVYHIMINIILAHGEMLG